MNRTRWSTCDWILMMAEIRLPQWLEREMARPEVTEKSQAQPAGASSCAFTPGSLGGRLNSLQESPHQGGLSPDSCLMVEPLQICANGVDRDLQRLRRLRRSAARKQLLRQS